MAGSSNQLLDICISDITAQTMLLSSLDGKYLLGLSWCAAVLLFLYDSPVWAVLNWHLRLLAFEQELHLLDVCFQICYCE